MSRAERMRLDFTGLRAAPSQVVGAVRLVPLLRDEPIEALHLYVLPTEADLTVVRLDERTYYTAYVPHALVVELPGQKQAHASLGTQLVRPRAKPEGVFRVQVLDRLARREGPRTPRAPVQGKAAKARPSRLRLLPQHLALDAYLSVGFAGPNVAWPEYSQQVLSRGLSPRSEHVYRGRDVPGLADALRVFELHPGQVGVLVFVADAFASAFVAPRPEDYRRLHRTLLEGMYGELLVQYAVLHPQAPALWQPLDPAALGSLDALGHALDGLRREWNAFAGLMASGLFDAELDVHTVQRLGGFRLQRFLPSFHPHADNHVGEAIVDAAGRLAYLETFRLSAAQARRGRLLATLVAVDWELEACAQALEIAREELLARLRNNGLEHLLKAHVR
jgi:hypothetical protein